MTVYKPTTTTSLALAAGKVQVRRGRVMVSLTATPAADDFLTFEPGQLLDLAVPAFVRAMDPGAVVVSINLTPPDPEPPAG